LKNEALSQNMHIGFLTPEYVMSDSIDGGLANYIRKVSLALVQRGHHVSVLVFSTNNTLWQDQKIVIHEIKSINCPYQLRRFPYLNALLPMTGQILSSLRMNKAVWKIHADTPFDILQASSYKSPGFSLRRNGRIPLVCRVSSYTPQLRSSYGRQRTLGDYLNDWLEIRQVLDADSAFAPSYFVANTYANIEGFRPKVIRTPVNLDNKDFDPSFFENHLSEKPYLLFFGTLSRIKGADLFAEVIPPVFRKYDDLVFSFIGRDDGLPNGEKVFEYIRSNCQQFAHRLFYSPAIPKAQLYPVIANAIGVVMPSRVDNYPNVCLEAQSMGIPVIGTYDSSLEEMIADGKTGFLAKNNDPINLREAIYRLLAMNSTEKLQMRNQILETIKSIKSEDRVGQLLSFYEAVIHKFNTDNE
jgi:glycosyltransferase involved in cell wall biosynthesis